MVALVGLAHVVEQERELDHQMLSRYVAATVAGSL